MKAVLADVRALEARVTACEADLRALGRYLTDKTSAPVLDRVPIRGAQLGVAAVRAAKAIQVDADAVGLGAKRKSKGKGK